MRIYNGDVILIPPSSILDGLGASEHERFLSRIASLCVPTSIAKLLFIADGNSTKTDKNNHCLGLWWVNSQEYK